MGRLPLENGLPQYVSKHAKSGLYQYYRRPPKGVAGSAFTRSFGTKDRKIVWQKWPAIHAEAEKYFERLITGRALTDQELYAMAITSGIAKKLLELKGVLHTSEHFIGVALSSGPEQVKELSRAALRTSARIAGSRLDVLRLATRKVLWHWLENRFPGGKSVIPMNRTIAWARGR